MNFVFGYEKGSGDEKIYRGWYAERYHSRQTTYNNHGFRKRLRSSTHSMPPLYATSRTHPNGPTGRKAVSSLLVHTDDSLRLTAREMAARAG